MQQPQVTSVRCHIPKGYAPGDCIRLEDIGGGFIDIKFGAKDWSAPVVSFSVESLEWVELAAVELANAAQAIRRARRDANQTTFPAA